jgi:hypothetical protein
MSPGWLALARPTGALCGLRTPMTSRLAPSERPPSPLKDIWAEEPGIKNYSLQGRSRRRSKMRWRDWGGP